MRINNIFYTRLQRGYFTFLLNQESNKEIKMENMQVDIKKDKEFIGWFGVNFGINL